MKKNGFLTFIFACIPGAGEMYYGYMQRGLSLITLFCVSFALGSIFSPVLVLVPIIWMYSFFDTYDLIRYLVKGDPKPDAILFISDSNSLKTLALDHNKLIGWIFVALGVWALYDNLLEPLLSSVLQALGIENAWYVLHQIPSVVVAVLLVYCGLKLLGIAPGGKRRPLDEIPPYPGEGNA